MAPVYGRKGKSRLSTVMTDIDEDPYGYVATREACIKYIMVWISINMVIIGSRLYIRITAQGNVSWPAVFPPSISVNLEIPVALGVLINLGVWMTPKGFLRRDIFAL